MKKIAFIGAGSFVFTRNLVRDILTFPAFCDCIIALMDIDEQRLEYIRMAVTSMVEHTKCAVKVVATTSRTEALRDADGVVITIRNSLLADLRNDVEIPKKYGVDICIGDTRGPAAIFRYLRTIPALMDICRDIERLCPNAIVLNYTNPMAMICRHLQTETKLQVTGLCHSVQGTVKQLAAMTGLPEDKMTYLCAGINHQSWYLDLKCEGKDVYPILREALKNKETFDRDKVRNEMFLQLGYFVTESSRHSSEYTPWFRKNDRTIRELVMGKPPIREGWPADGEFAYNYKMYNALESVWREDIVKSINEEQGKELQRGNEYAACIFNAVFGDGQLFEFNGNLRNFGLVDNLPDGCCVEVPVLASPYGLKPVHVGKLPTHLAIITGTNAGCEELAVEAALEHDLEKLFQSVCFDPLTSAILALGETRAMVTEMLTANKGKLPMFPEYA